MTICYTSVLLREKKQKEAKWACKDTTTSTPKNAEQKTSLSPTCGGKWEGRRILCFRSTTVWACKENVSIYNVGYDNINLKKRREKKFSSPTCDGKWEGRRIIYFSITTECEVSWSLGLSSPCSCYT